MMWGAERGAWRRGSDGMVEAVEVCLCFSFDTVLTVLRCIFVIGGFVSLVLLLLALRNNTFRMVSASCMHLDK